MTLKGPQSAAKESVHSDYPSLPVLSPKVKKEQNSGDNKDVAESRGYGCNPTKDDDDELARELSQGEFEENHRHAQCENRDGERDEKPPAAIVDEFQRQNVEELEAEDTVKEKENPATGSELRAGSRNLPFHLFELLRVEEG